jgi:hypothetical protein
MIHGALNHLDHVVDRRSEGRIGVRQQILQVSADELTQRFFLLASWAA